MTTTEPTINDLAVTKVRALDAAGEPETVSVKGDHLKVNDRGVLVVDGGAGEVAAFAPGHWTYAHATVPQPGQGDDDDPTDLVARLNRAVARLQEHHDEVRGPSSSERARLAGKIEGVKLALSYFAEIQQRTEAPQ